jgi:hypothetical protein
LAALPSLPSFAVDDAKHGASSLYGLFGNPPSACRPFVRWWWNGNRIQADELIRELHVLKAAGVGGVEINAVKFPDNTDDLGVKSLQWLSDEWVDMLQLTFDEAKKLDMICDLAAGSGTPFGGDFLQGAERGQMMVTSVVRLEGPMRYETSAFHLLKDADPKIAFPYSGRIPHLVSLKLVPDLLDSTDQETDLSSGIDFNDTFLIDVPKGKHVLYALVRVDAFAGIVNGAPGASGPALNYLNANAVMKYLTHVSESIESRIGALSNNVRSLFSGSIQPEEANWTEDMADTFRARNGYDIMPCLPYILSAHRRGADMSPGFREMILRMYCDLEATKAEMLRERFGKTYVEWCRSLNVRSRLQACGGGFFSVEGVVQCDIPEGASWTANRLHRHDGKEMHGGDARRERAYGMINRYVASSARLSGKRLVGAEEMTDMYRGFNTTLELLKIGCDRNTIAGVTHSIFNGFNYSPAEAPFPGWIRHGAYYSERNNWWNYLKYLNDYRARVSAILQNTDMYADIALLPPAVDMPTATGDRDAPLPAEIDAPYRSLLWETIHKNGNGADDISESVILASKVKDGWMYCGKRKYHSIFLMGTERMQPAALAVLYDFVASGGQVFCLEKYPLRSLGWRYHDEYDREAEMWLAKLKAMHHRFVLLKKPDDDDFMAWYLDVQRKYRLKPFVAIEKPDEYMMVNRYIGDDRSEFFFFANLNPNRSCSTVIRFPKETTARRYGWIWDLTDGKRYRIDTARDGGFLLYLAPADSRLIVFDREEKGEWWDLLPADGRNGRTLTGWDVELRHSCEIFVDKTRMHVPEDLRNTQYVNFTGTVFYNKKFHVDHPQQVILNLGRVWGISEVKINGKPCGVCWYGDHLYDLSGKLKQGENELEIKVTTPMGNYIRTLAENTSGQQWINSQGSSEPKQSMGLAGPVSLYEG